MITDGINFKQEEIPFTQIRSNDLVWYVTRGTAIAFPFLSNKCAVKVSNSDLIISFSFGSEISFDTHLKRNKASWPLDTLLIDNLDIRRTYDSQFQHFVIMLCQTAKFHGYAYLGMHLVNPRLIALLKHVGFTPIYNDAYVINLAEEFNIKEWIDELLSPLLRRFSLLLS